MIVAVAGGEIDAIAERLSQGMQLGSSRAYLTDYVNYEYWRVWARRADGHLVSVLEEPAFPEATWTDWGVPGGFALGNQGVAATSWSVGTDQFESVFYLSGNNVVETRLKNRVVDVWQTFGPPPGTGRTLTGYFAVAWRDPPGTGAGAEPRPLVYVTAKDNVSSANVRVFVLDARDNRVGPGTWTQISSGDTDYSATSPLAASNTRDGSFSRVFASTTGGNLREIRWNGGAGPPVTLPPPAGKQLCGTIAAAEGNVGPAGGFRAYVFCSRRDAAESQLLFRFTTDVTGGVGGWSNWGAIQLAGGATVTNTGYALAATTLGMDGVKGVDVYALSSTSQLLVARRTPQGEMPASFADLGDDGEYVWRSGGLAATQALPNVNAFSHGLYIGNIQSSNRLYRRNGDPSQPDSTASNWTNHGSSTGRQFIVSDERVYEPSTAFFRGRSLTAYTRQSNDPALREFVRAKWSNEDGESYGASVELSRGSDPLDPSTDTEEPHVVFADTGTAYVVMRGHHETNDACAGPEDSEIFLQSTTDGLAYSAPTRLHEAASYVKCDVPDPVQDYCPGDPAHPGCTLVSCGQPLDHCFCPECTQGDCRRNRLGRPWMDIERRAGQADRLHVIWTDRNPNASGVETPGIRYLRTTTPVAADPPTVFFDEFAEITGPQMFVVTVGPGGVAYIGSGVQLCRVDTTTFDSCESLLVYREDLDRSTSGYSAAGDAFSIPGTSERLAGPASFSLVASPSDPNTVYYAFQRPEGDPPGITNEELDVWFEVITFNPNTGTLDRSQRIPLTDVLVDDRDQFQPALTVVQDLSVGDTVFASWYDRRGPACAGSVNRCYRAKRSVFRPSLLAFAYTQDIPVVLPPDNPASDPHLLPVSHCYTTDVRSLGAYHQVTADRLHSFHTVVGAPWNGAAGTATLTRGWVSRGFWSW